MNKVLPAVLFVLFSGCCLFGQTGQATMTPPTVLAGKNITVTVTVNRPANVQQTSLNVRVVPKEPKDNAPAFGFNLGRKNENEPTIYVGTSMVPPNAKGVWRIETVKVDVPQGGQVELETNHPEFTVIPIQVILPTSGKVEVASP